MDTNRREFFGSVAGRLLVGTDAADKAALPEPFPEDRYALLATLAKQIHALMKPATLTAEEQILLNHCVWRVEWEANRQPQRCGEWKGSGPAPMGVWIPA